MQDDGSEGNVVDLERVAVRIRRLADTGAPASRFLRNVGRPTRGRRRWVKRGRGRRRRRAAKTFAVSREGPHRSFGVITLTATAKSRYRSARDSENAVIRCQPTSSSTLVKERPASGCWIRALPIRR